MKFGVAVFPGTWSDTDCHYVVCDILGQQTQYVWHQETDLTSYDCMIIPGGFSYGDYLRAGAIAKFSPVMQSMQTFAQSGRVVIGICNGFQILCESGLLPGILRRNEHLQYRCQWTNLLTETTNTPFTNNCTPGQILAIPVSHGEGNYYADNTTLTELESNGRILFRYCDKNGNTNDTSNPNGSVHNIAGITNHEGNVLGMMPHPERSCEKLLGSTDGNLIFQSIIDSHVTK